MFCPWWPIGGSGVLFLGELVGYILGGKVQKDKTPPQVKTYYPWKCYCAFLSTLYPLSLSRAQAPRSMSSPVLSAHAH